MCINVLQILVMESVFNSNASRNLKHFGNAKNENLLKSEQPKILGVRVHYEKENAEKGSFEIKFQPTSNLSKQM